MQRLDVRLYPENDLTETQLAYVAEKILKVIEAEGITGKVIIPEEGR